MASGAGRPSASVAGSPGSVVTSSCTRPAELGARGATPDAALTCVANLSEGRDAAALARIVAAAGDTLLDLHSDFDHHRSVATLLVETGTLRRVLARAVELLSLVGHVGVHPRVGVLDVVPFVPLRPGATLAELAGADLDAAIATRDATGAWLAEQFSVPCFAYGPAVHGGERTLPDIRRRAFTDLVPDWGPAAPHARAGAVCLGARRVLVAYNVVLDGADIAFGRSVATALRGPEVRTLAFPVAAGVQISANLVAPWRVGPADFYDAVAARAAAQGVRIVSAELVGLLPAAVLTAIAPERWDQLDLGPERTLEARLAAVGG